MSNKTSFKDIYKRAPIRDRNFVMPFGKYVGTPLHEIIDNDPQYIVWLQTGDGIEFHADIMDEVEQSELINDREQDDRVARDY